MSKDPVPPEPTSVRMSPSVGAVRRILFRPQGCRPRCADLPPDGDRVRTECAEVYSPEARVRAARAECGDAGSDPRPTKASTPPVASRRGCRQPDLNRQPGFEGARCLPLHHGGEWQRPELHGDRSSCKDGVLLLDDAAVCRRAPARHQTPAGAAPPTPSTLLRQGDKAEKRRRQSGLARIRTPTSPLQGERAAVDTT